MKLTLIFIVLFTSLITYGQDANEQLTKNIYTSTKSYKELFMTQNYEELSNSITPKLIEYLKTKQDFVYLLTQLTKNAEEKGITITDIAFGKHTEIIEHKNQLQTVVPFELKMENDERLINIGSGIALVSTNKGQNWYFTFQVIKDKAENNRVLGLNENINIPTRTQNITAK